MITVGDQLHFINCLHFVLDPACTWYYYIIACILLTVTLADLALKFATHVAIAIHRGLICTVIDYNFTLSSSIVP